MKSSIVKHFRSFSPKFMPVLNENIDYYLAENRKN